MLGFAAPAWRRVVVALAYGAVAFAVVAWVDSPRQASDAKIAAVSTARPTPDAASVAIEITATFDVAQWTVRVDGEPLTPDASQARSWRGVATARGAAGELFVDAIGAEEGAPPQALRLVVLQGSERAERTVWLDEASATQRWAFALDGPTAVPAP